MKGISGKGRVYWPLLVLGLAVLVAVLLIVTRPRPAPLAPAERAWLVAVQPVHLQAAAPEVTLYGYLESLWPSQLSAGVAADVEQVLVVDGDQVAKGDLLVQLDERESRLRLAQREADLQDARARLDAEQVRYETDRKSLTRERRLLTLVQAEVNRLRDLVRKQAGAKSALDNARQAVERQAVAVASREQSIEEHAAREAQLEAALQRATAARDEAQLELERCTVRAPFGGRVSQVDVAPGRRVRVGDPLLTLYDTAAMVLRAQIPDRYLSAVRKAVAEGSPPKVRGSLDHTAVKGTLRQFAGEVDPNSGGLLALFDVAAAGDVLQKGRFIEVEMELPPVAGVMLVPYPALYGPDTLYVVDDESRMHSIKVQRLGEVRLADGSTRVLVRSPQLRQGQHVVVTHLPNALDGLLVRTAEAPQTGS